MSALAGRRIPHRCLIIWIISGKVRLRAIVEGLIPSQIGSQSVLTELDIASILFCQKICSL